MAEERPGSWFGFGFCGFGQVLGSGRGLQVLSPEPLRVADAGADICGVSAAWSYTAILSRERPLPFRPAHSGPSLSLPLQAPPEARVPASCSTLSPPCPAPSLQAPPPPPVPASCSARPSRRCGPGAALGLGGRRG